MFQPGEEVGEVGDVGNDRGRLNSLLCRSCTPSSRDTLRFLNNPRRIMFSWNSWYNNEILAWKPEKPAGIRIVCLQGTASVIDVPF